MPLFTPAEYLQTLGERRGRSALLSVTCYNVSMIRAALTGFANADVDGILSFSIDGCTAHGAGDPVLGAEMLADAAARLADAFSIRVALHTDHCPPAKLDSFLRPLLEISADRVRSGRPPLFHSQMFDGSMLPLDENLSLAMDLGPVFAAARVLPEFEVGTVGGDEEGRSASVDSTVPYTSPEAVVNFCSALRHPFLLAAAFGNFHGHYRLQDVPLRPEVLQEGAAALAARHPHCSAPLFVFHGGSGLEMEDWQNAVDAGTVKINLNTECREAYTAAIAHHTRQTQSPHPLDLQAAAEKAMATVVEQKAAISRSLQR